MYWTKNGREFHLLHTDDGEIVGTIYTYTARRHAVQITMYIARLRSLLGTFITTGTLQEAKDWLITQVVLTKMGE